MEDLFGALIPLLLVAAGWLFNSSKNENNDKKPPAKKVNPTPSSSPPPSGNGRQRVELPQSKKETATELEPKSYYEKKQEQIDQLKNQLEHQAIDVGQTIQDQSIHDAIKEEDQHTPVAYKKNKQRSKEKLSVNRALTKNGLAQSVIMAEVLGPPRALKPYKNGLQHRNK